MNKTGAPKYSQSLPINNPETETEINMTKELIIDRDFKSLCPPLAQNERDALEQSLNDEGCRDPIVAWNGVILDGHNRYEICKKRNIDFKTVEREMPDRAAAMDWIVKNQIAKRNVSAEQKSEMRGKRYNAEKASHGGVRKASAGGPHLKTADRLAVLFGVDASTIRSDGKYAEGLERIRAVDPELRLSILAGDSGVTKATIENIETLRENEVSPAVAAIKTGVTQGRAKPSAKKSARAAAAPVDASMVTLLEGPITGAPVEPRSVDLILTQALPDADFASLAKFAAHVLKSSGSLLVRVDQRRLPMALTQLSAVSASMAYRWTVAVVKPGGPTSAADNSVKTRWTPMLWFAKDECSFGDVNDLLDGKAGDGFTSAERQLATVIDKFTTSGGVVCDPWAADETTIAVAAKLGRQFIGIVSSAKRLKSFRKKVNLGLDPKKAATSATASAPAVVAHS